MKRFTTILTIIILLFVPWRAQSEIIARSPQMAVEMYKIRHDNLTMGDIGHFYIPSVGIEVPLYSASEDMEQSVVDAPNSALYRKTFHGGCGYIVDHASQGFDKIKQCELGCNAYIKSEDGIHVYRCIEIVYGKNLRGNLWAENNQFLTDIDWADYCCYTCNDGEGVSIAMVFFKEIK